MRKNNKKGFTLVELLIVIAIFALIANVTMISLGKARRESRDAQRMSDISQLRSALHLYSLEYGEYPDGEDLALGVGSNLILSSAEWSTDTTPPIFMYSVQRDPRMINQSASACTASSDDICDYGYSINSNDFTIYFYLEGNVGDMTSGLHAATKDTVI